MTFVPMKREQMWTCCDIRKVVDIDANDCHALPNSYKGLKTTYAHILPVVHSGGSSL